MHRFLLLLLLVVLAGIGAWCYFARSGPDSVPMIRLTPARPSAPADQAPSPGLRPAEPIAPGLTPADATRTNASGPAVAPGNRAAVLDVRVVLAASDEPLEGIDVGITVAASETAGAHRDMQRTDPGGLVRFAVPAGDQRLAEVWSGLGGEGSARLMATEPVAVTLRIAARCLVDGQVVNAGGQPIADAEIVFLPWFDRSSDGMPATLRVGTSRRDGSFRIGLAAGGRLGAQHRDYAPSTMHAVQLEPDRNKPAATTTLRLALLTMPARARGSVVSHDGTPLGLAMLEFRAVESGSVRAELAAPPQRTRSDVTGFFEVQHLRPGAISYVARLPGHGTTSGRIDATAGATADLRITMAQACDVRGVAQDANGVLLAGISAWSGTEGAFDGTATLSGADGTFWLRDLAPGPTELTARESTRRPGRARARATTRLDLVPGVTAWIAGLEATAGPMLRGLVVDTAGSPLANWRIVTQQGASTAQPARTDAEGEFAVRVMGPGRFEIHVFAPEQPPMSFAMAAAHAIDATHGVVRIVVDLGRLPASMRGIVQSHVQEPLAASVACWHHELRVYARVVADKSGAFRIDRVPPGTIDLYVDHPGHAGISKRDLVVTAGADLDLGVVQLGAASAVHGTVLGPDGQPPAQIQISILTADKQITAEYTAGTYRLTAVPPGKHTLQVQGPGVAATKFPIEVPAGAELQQDIQLQPGIARKFKVEFAAGSCTWVTLVLRLPNEAHTWISGAAVRGGGAVEFEAFMASGTYEAVAWSNTDLQGRANVTFVPGDESEVRIGLHKQ